jgi:hypothetical protein
MRKLSLILFLAIAGAGCLIYLPYKRNAISSASTSDAPPVSPRVHGEISIALIYDYLADYGYWVDYHPYGYVWIPRGVGRPWHPYTHGRWAWTEYGWTWLSSYRWGWIAFHYGRWGWDNRLGWFWVPDVAWSPAWVVWRYGDLYVGWAPLPPGAEFVAGYGLRWNSRSLPHHYWIFVEGRRFCSPQLRSWILPPERNITIINYTVVRDRYTVGDRYTIINDGLSLREIEGLTRKPVTKVKLKEVQRPEEARIDSDEVRIYRPGIKSEEVTPKIILKKEEAEKRIRPQEALESPERVEEIHRQEAFLMERTQKAEVEQLKRQNREETRAAAPQEKQQRVIEAQSKVDELKKKHQEEKQELMKRQQEEKRVLRKENLKKKTEDQKRS